MKLPFRIDRVSRTLLGCGFLVAAAISFALWPTDRPLASRQNRGSTQPVDREIPNYDIRLDKEAGETLARFRTVARKTTVDVARLRDAFVRGEQRLRQRVSTLKVEYNTDLRTPEVISLDAAPTRTALMRTGRTGRADTLRAFLSQNTELLGVPSEQVAQLRTAADYTNPEGGLSFVELDQEINGIPVFRGEVKAGFTAKGEMFRVINNLAPGVDAEDVPSEFGEPADAVVLAEGFIGKEIAGRDRSLQDFELSTPTKAVFGRDASAPTAEKIYFPAEPGVVVAAWRVLISAPLNSYYVIVDARTGTMLWRKDLTDDQTQPATYYVYSQPDATINLAPNPYPLWPGPSGPNGAQGIAIKRLPVRRIGNEPPYTFNDRGWITDGVTKTDGNAVQAGLDRAAPDDIDDGGEAFSSSRVFKYDFRPTDPNGGTAATPPVPTPQTYPGSAFQQGSVTQLFYAVNLWHDEMYLLGFNEQARNFQDDNFGRGGLGGDRIRADAQDWSGSNNSNFTTFADGTRPKMQMYLFTSPNPDIDSDFDATVVLHEATHGMSQRLHGNAAGLGFDLAGGMNEGWSDFFALALLSRPSDPIDGTYTVGGYDRFLYPGIGTNNNYYGIRRFPTAIMSATGGPMNRPHNPLTFQDIDETKINISDGAFAPASGGLADGRHNIGELWCNALWEIRARMMQRVGNAVGNRRIMQFVIDGMKLAPLNPTPITERDAMISAALADGTAEDVADIWAGFAVRGIGANASIDAYGGNSTGGTGTVRVTESFDLPNIIQSPSIAVSDQGGNDNGVAEPGETVIVSVPLTNNTGATVTAVTLEMVGIGMQNYGDLTHAATVARTFTYTIPANTPCGSVITLTLNANSGLGPITFTRDFVVGTPVTTFAENFDTVSAPAVPAGWTVTSSLPAMTFVSTAASSDTAPNSMFATNTPTGGSTELISPVLALNAQGGTVTFRHSFNTEPGWDGGVLDISIAGGPFQDIVAAGGVFLQNGYTAFVPTSGGNPISGRFEWTGNSGGYLTSVARMPASAAGQTIQLRWRFGADNNTAPAGGGWNVDSISFAGSFSCSPALVSFATVSGRVLTPEDSGLRNAKVSLVNDQGSTVTVATGARGTFHFAGVECERGYVLAVASRNYIYTPQVLKVSGTVSDLLFVPVVGKRPSINKKR